MVLVETASLRNKLKNVEDYQPRNFFNTAMKDHVILYGYVILILFAYYRQPRGDS